MIVALQWTPLCYLQHLTSDDGKAADCTAHVNTVSGVSTCRLLVLGQLAPGTLHEMQYWVRFITLCRPATNLVWTM